MDTLEKRPRGEKGQSMVELVLSLLFLFMLVAGVVDLGRAFFTYSALRDAAQEGAAYASIARTEMTDPMKCAEIVNRVQSTSNTQIVDLTQTTVSVSLDGVPCGGATNWNACYSREVRVVVSDPNFTLTTPFLGAAIGRQTVPITASILDTVLTPPCQ